MRHMVAAIAMGVLAAAPARAHGGHAHAAPPEAAPGFWALWTWDPAVVVGLVVLGVVYATGLRRLWAATGAGRGVSMGQAAAVGCGLAVVAAALISPIDRLSDEVSWMHMVQHMLLMMVAAPLFVVGNPLLTTLWALPGGGRRRLAARLRQAGWRRPGYWLFQPLLTWSLFAFTLWIWHLPVFYEAALAHPWVHHGQHLAFFTASCLFWRVVLDPLSRLRLSPVLGVIYLFTTSLHATLLGVFMALAPRAWYPFYQDRTGAWQLTPLEDQQLAGLIMWMPACMVYAVVVAALVALWLRAQEQRA